MNDKEKSMRICVYGVVQGVGFRPFVARTAMYYHLTGSVANKGSYVEIYVKGIESSIQQFLMEVKKHPPERATVLKVDQTECSNIQAESFEIIESEKEAGDIFVSPDIATCDLCKKELYDKTNRRYLHPFINCTACGPRLTILDSMPYDRERTSMGEFPMCPSCEYEYTHSETRRYDAQPVCCPECGPEVYLIHANLTNQDAIRAARKLLSEGKIIAIKGIGGFHLCCDACNEEAVQRLRKKKHRPVKPFAVMMKNLDTVKKHTKITDSLTELIDGHQKPIILLHKKQDSSLAPSVAPGNPKVGVMLPYAPIQMLLFDYPEDSVEVSECLVMTSANQSGAPIVRNDEDALAEINDFCDDILSNNRKILLRADDSVMDLYNEEPYMIRRSRGYAPLPVMSSYPLTHTVLAVGGELKNTFCIGKKQLFYPSPYVGDMADIRTVTALSESMVRLETLLEAKPELVVCDLHPKYNTTTVALSTNLPVCYVQHHYAHILSCMAENDYLEPVIGVAMDGTGYGTDHTIWGGEILSCSLTEFKRLGSIDPFLWIGGDQAAKEGYRIAISMINELYQDQAAAICDSLGLGKEEERALYEKMAQRRINSVISTSAGRLFDAVSAILGICKSSTFEGEAAMKLEFLAESYHPDEKKETEFELCHQRDETYFYLSTKELVKRMINGRLAKEDTTYLAYFFHKQLAEMITAGCKQASKETGCFTVALSGGVFQNVLLLQLCETKLKQEGFTVLRHHLIPPNDGGIALGQALYGAVFMEQGGN